jgi:hypothetical protein
VAERQNQNEQELPPRSYRISPYAVRVNSEENQIRGENMLREAS